LVKDSRSPFTSEKIFSFNSFCFQALDFAGNDEITIYLSPEDRSLAEKLQHTTGTAIQLAKDSFLGGIRATIPQKNILIDHSFAGNFEAAYKEFKFDGGPEHE